MSESIIRIIFYGGEFWFIYTLMIIFIIYPVIFRLAGASKRRMLVFLLVFALLSYHGTSINFFCANSVIYYMFFFHLGAAVKMLFGRLNFNAPVWALLLAFALWMIFLYAATISGIIIALIGITVCCIASGYKVFNDIFSRFGEYSLQMYLINGIMLGISRAVICNVLHVSQPAVIITFNTLADFLGAYVLIKYILLESRIIRMAMGMLDSRKGV